MSATSPLSPSSPEPRFTPHPAVVAIVLTASCNANCGCCPRHHTPHQGLIDEAALSAALRRAVEYRDALLELEKLQPGYADTHDDTIWLSFCGMGEPLLHPRVVEYVGRVAQAGLRPLINTNGALLSPRRAEELLEAGLAMACLNVGEIDEQYEAVYDLPFERTRTNVEHFLATAGDRCISLIVLVDHRDDPDHLSAMQEYWSRRGAKGFVRFSLVNRAGSLPVDEQVDAWHAYRDVAERMLREKADAARCWVPFLTPFIGDAGKYYHVASDTSEAVDRAS